MSAKPPARESWRGPLAIAASLLGLALCIGLALGFTAFDLLPSALDRYVNLKLGQTNLYRVTYADGSQGFLSENVVQPDSDALPYARLFGDGGAAVQIHSIYTNWQGTGQIHARDDYYARTRTRLLLIAQRNQNGTTTQFKPPLSLWAVDLFAEPVIGETDINGTAVAYRIQRDRTEPITLPNGKTAEATVLVSQYFFQDQVYDQVTSWLVRNVGLVRSEEFDGQGKLLQRLELLNGARLTGAATPPILQSSTSTTSFFREDAARTGAHPEAVLPRADFNIAYRLTTDQAFTASPLVADGLLYTADQSGTMTAYDAVQGAPRWRFSAGGAIVAAPAIADGIIYFGAGDKTLYALTAADGLYLWSRRLNDSIATSPVLAEGTLFVGGEDRKLYALDPLTGNVRWTFTAGDRLVSSPAIAGGTVFFGSDDSLLYALDAATGEVRWRYSLESRIGATPAVSPDGIVYAVSTDGRVAAVDAATGEERWTADFRFGFIASPAVGGGFVFVADEDSAVRALDAQLGEVVWEWNEAAHNFVGSPLLLGDRLLAVNSDGTLYVFNAGTGDVIQTLNVGSNVSASPTWDAGQVYVTNQAREIYALQPTDRPGLLFNPIWQNDANLTGGYNVPSADLLYTHDSLIVTKYQGEVIAVNPEDGAATSLIQLGETIEGLTPAVAGDTLYIAAGSGRVTAYNLSQRGVQWQTKVSGQLLFGPATDGARVYAQSTANQDNVVALDAATGQTAWTQTISGSAGAPVIAEGKLFVAGDAVHALDPETGGELWKSETFLSVGGLAVYNGVVYAGGVGNDDVTFLALDAETGHVMWQRREQALFFKNRPAYDAGSKAIFIGAKDGGLYAFDAASGERRWRFQADNAIQSNVQVLDGVVYFTTFSGATYAVEAGMGILRSNFKPGTPVNTTGAPVILPGRAFVVNGATVYGLIVEK